jgi:streptomycin 6-kinase
VPRLDLTAARALAEQAASHWGVTLGPPFTTANASYVAPAAAYVVKVAWEGDDESLHEPEALDLWNEDEAVRLVDRFGRALLLERAIPGTDLSAVGEAEATAVAVELASRLWRPAQGPFRAVVPTVRGWIARAQQEGSELGSIARELLDEIGPSADWLVHGDFHHHNVLQRGDRYVAIDPKPYLADREYDVPPFLWNPIGSQFDDPDLIETRIAAFASAGLDEFRIRAWTVIRGAYLQPALARPIRELLERHR